MIWLACIYAERHRAQIYLLRLTFWTFKYKQQYIIGSFKNQSNFLFWKYWVSSAEYKSAPKWAELLGPLLLCCTCKLLPHAFELYSTALFLSAPQTHTNVQFPLACCLSIWIIYESHLLHPWVPTICILTLSLDKSQLRQILFWRQSLSIQ